MRLRISPRQTVRGHAFADHIGFEESRRKVHESGGDDKRGFRDIFLIACLFLFCIALVFKLFFVEIVQGSSYRNLSDSNRTKTEVIHAPRGIIFDRNGVPLVYNAPGFRTSNNGKTVLLNRDEALSQLAKGAQNIEVDSLRMYPFKEAFAHVLGYIGQISEDELKMPEFDSYKSGDLIGKMGIEQQYERILKGIDGKTLVEIDASGKPTRKLGTSDPIPGENITLTLDSKLQKAAFDAMKDVKKGAVIVSTPQGEILAMISMPSFDPNSFTLSSNYKPEGPYQSISQILLDSDNQPLLNRAISGTYPPGSTFKLINAAAGLTNHIIDENYQVEDNGVITLGAFSFSNWYFSQYGKTEGSVDVVKAIKRSNDIFFYTLAGKVGVDTISKTAQKFGLGQQLGIDLAVEAHGVLPTQEWKQKNIGEPWYLGDTYHYGIGQGYLLTTPLQVNGWTQAIANGGILYQPHLLKSLKPKVLGENLLDSHSFDLIRQGMMEACDTGGVAWPIFGFQVNNPKLQIDGRNITETAQSTSSAQFSNQRHVVVACKTGTAQHGGEETLPHAWITMFAPAYNPQIVVTVLSESSGEGSNIAAPIAKKILEEWFGR